MGDEKMFVRSIYVSIEHKKIFQNQPVCWVPRGGTMQGPAGIPKNQMKTILHSTNFFAFPKKSIYLILLYKRNNFQIRLFGLLRLNSLQTNITMKTINQPNDILSAQNYAEILLERTNWWLFAVSSMLFSRNWIHIYGLTYKKYVKTHMGISGDKI